MASGLDKAVAKTRREVKRVFVRLGLAQPYQEEFFDGFAEIAAASAKAVVPTVMELVRPRSVVDVGCGLGFWLREFGAAGVAELQGFDGDWVRPEKLVIPAANFASANLAGGVTAGRTFDLAVSLEVAEHLPESSADGFVRSLTALAPVVLFSAAIPGQGGTGHINEQWPGYWAVKFEDRGYIAVDCIRPRVWTDQRVAWWYAQNAVVYVRRSELSRFAGLAEWAGRQPAGSPLPLVHPRPFERLVRRVSRA